MKDLLFIYKEGKSSQVSSKPFCFELAMEGYIADNPNILSNAELDFTYPEIKDLEKVIGINKRIDIFVQYSNDIKAVVELKNVTIDMSALHQLRDYLSILSKTPEEKDSQLIGILVGPEFDKKVLTEIEKGENIFGVELHRYFEDGQWFVFTKWYIPNNWLTNKKDYTKYSINSNPMLLGKGRLVYEVIKDYIANHPNEDFTSLQKIFPDSLRSKKNTKYHVIAKENSVAIDERYARYFKEPLTNTFGERIIVSSQWGIGNIAPFIEYARTLRYTISEYLI